MNPLERLEALGFTDAALVGVQRTKTVFRVRTAKGWQYEKFDTEALPDALDAWASKHQPG